MDRLELDYNELEIETRRHAGLDGVSIIAPEHGTIVTVFKSDTKLINAIDEALHRAYHTETE